MRRSLSLIIVLLVALTALVTAPAVRSAGEAIAPQVIDTAPVRGEELPVEAAITFYFDQPMDQASVQSALQSSPAVQGALTWSDEKTAVFKPSGPLQRGTEYTFTVGTQAKGTNGVGLKDVFTARFRTVGFLEVTQVLPADSSSNISANPVITVIFNRPIVPLSTPEEMAKQPSPITIAPGVEGQGEWSSTSIYTFKPTMPLKGGVQYTVIVPKALTSIDGAVLQNDYSFKFSVAVPQVLSLEVFADNRYIDPANATINIPREAKVSVTFSQPMDTATTEAAFSMNGPSGKVAGKFEWNAANNKLTFIPDAPLDYGKQFTARMDGSAARSASGTPLDKDAQTAFTTVGLPDILRSYPNNGEVAEVYGGFSLEFNVPMKLDDIKNRVTFDPPATSNDSEFISPEGTNYSTGRGVDPSTTYTVTIDVNGLVDRYGTPFTPNPNNTAYRIIEPGKVQITYTTQAFPPSIELQRPGEPGVYSANRPSTQIYTAHTNVQKVDLSLFSLPIADFLRMNGPNSYQAITGYVPQQLLRSWTVPLSSPPNATRYDLLTISAQGPSNGAGPSAFTCAGAPPTRLAVGMSAIVAPDDPTPLRVRGSAGLTGQQITQLKPNTPFKIIGGPQCVDGYVWWNIQTDDGTVTGWAAEGTVTNYFIAPVGQAPAPAQPASTGGDANAPLAPGAYYLLYNAPELAGVPGADQRPTHVMLVARSGVTVKFGPHQMLAWVTDLQSGQPVPNVAVQFYTGKYDPQNQNLAPAAFQAPVQTDANGLARIDGVPNLLRPEDLVAAVVTTEPNFGVGTGAWSQGIDPYFFNQPVDFDPRAQTVYIYSDRSIYQPGQPIYFKGTIRMKDDITYTLPTIKQITVQAINDQNESVYNKSIPVNAFGSFADSFTLPESVALGNYRILALPEYTGGDLQTYAGPRYERYFQVAQYRLPEYKVEATPDKTDVLQGETVRVTVSSSYFFGGAVKNADVTWLVLANPYSFDYKGNGRYNFFNYNEDESPFFGNNSTFGLFDKPFVADGKGRTDDQGNFVIEVPASLGKGTNSLVYTVEARVTDPSQQEIVGTKDVVVHAGEFYIGVAPENFVGNANQPQQVNLITVDWNSQARPNTDLSVKVVERQWTTTQDIDPQSGQPTFKSTVTENTVTEQVVKTDGDGKANFSFTPSKGGVYKVYATSRDSKEHQITSSAYLYVAGPGYTARVEENSRITIKVDRENYKIGDTASILIPNPFVGEAKALVTVERGKVLQTHVISVAEGTSIFKLPITPDLAPNAYVGVLIVKGEDSANPVTGFRVGMTSFNVDPERFKLNITVTPSQPEARPGDTVSYKLKVTDYSGKPIEAEVGVGLTDLASLSVAPDTNTPILEAFFGQQLISIKTGTAYTLNVDIKTEALKKIVDQLNALGPNQRGGGGGGGGGGGPEAPADVREKFIDTPLWEPYAKTDANGEATVTVTLPDNLTQWRLEARAITTPTGELSTTLVGQTKFDLTSTKALIVRPVTPRFYVMGDTGTLAAVVNNNTGADQDVKVRLDAQGITLKSNAEQTVKVTNGSTARVEWQIEVQDAAAVDATFSASTADKQFTDAAKSQAGQGADRTLPILRFEVPSTVGTGGSIGKEGGSKTEGISLPPRLNVAQGNVAITADPSLAASAIAALKALENFPLQSREALVSNILPNLQTYGALKGLGIDDPTLRDTLTKNINFAVQKLETDQHPDGGWGWTGTSSSDALVTAYVVMGLSEAQKQGFAVDTDILQQATTFIANYLNQRGNLSIQTPTWELNRWVFEAYALAKANVQVPAAALLPLREKMSIYARALLAMTIHIQNPGDTNNINLAVSDFQNLAIRSATGVHWQESLPDSVNWNTDTRTTAIVLQALIQLQPNNALIPDVVRWLMVARRADAWETPQETAWAVMALTSWMAATGELKPNYSFGVTLNDKPLAADQKAAPENAQQQIKLNVPIVDLVAGQPNALTFQRSAGDGMLYYTAHLTAYVPLDQVKALSRGVTVSRAYSLMSDLDKKPITQAKVGDAIRVTVSITVPNDLNYVVLYDPIPAGTDPVNPDLATTGTIGQQPQLAVDDPLKKGFGWWWFSNTELRYDRTVMYATFLPKGSYQFTYTIQATLPGQYHVLPATAQEVYFPEVYGRSDAAVFTILPKE